MSKKAENKAEAATPPTDEKTVEQHGEIPELDPNNPDVRHVTYYYNMRTGHTSLQSNALTPAEVVLLLGQATVSIAHRIREDEVELAARRAQDAASSIVKPGDPGFQPMPGIPSVIKTLGRPN